MSHATPRSRPSLLGALDVRFRVEVGDRSFARDDLIAYAVALAAELPVDWSGRVIEVPARDPIEALAHIEAALLRRAVPLPSTRVGAPELASGLEHVRAPDLGLVLRTSGSTGAPRHPGFHLGAVLRSASRIASRLGLEPWDVVGLLQPCDHGFGLVGQLLAAGLVGARVVGASRAFPNERAEVLLGARTSVMAAVPFGLVQLAPVLARAATATPGALGALRQIGVAGGALAPSLARTYRELAPGAVLVHQYGCTEAGPRLTTVASNEPGFDAGSVGRPLAGVTLLLDEPDERGVGEITFVSDMAMDRYVGDDAATERARLVTPRGIAFRTGDLGRLDATGALHVEGRIDDVVKLRGEKVSLELVARVAEENGARAALALVVPGAGDPHEGTLALVYEGEHALGAVAFVGRLPRGVLPKRLLHVARLPRLASGKVDRVAARALLLADTTPRLGARG